MRGRVGCLGLEHLQFPLRLDAYETLAMLGLGGYSLVRLVRLRGTAELFAIKQVALCEIVDEYQLKLAMTEIEVFSAEKSYTRLYCSMQRYLRDARREASRERYTKIMNLIKTHASSLLLKCFASWHDDHFLYMLLEYTPGCDLMSHLVLLKRLDERAAATLLAQVLLALGYLHDFVGFCHRDIKPDNVLIDARGQPKLADFGLARALPLVLLDQSKPAAREAFYSPMGTVEYMPVEIVRAAKPYTRVCDFWCVGVLMFEMLAGEMPFSLQGGSKRELKQSILAHGALLDHWPPHVPLSAAARDLLQRLIAEPQQRYSNVYAVLSHPWFAQVQLDELFSQPSPLRIDPQSLASRMYFARHSLDELSAWELARRVPPKFPGVLSALARYRVPRRFRADCAGAPGSGWLADVAARLGGGAPPGWSAVLAARLSTRRAREHAALLAPLPAQADARRRVFQLLYAPRAADALELKSDSDAVSTSGEHSSPVSETAAETPAAFAATPAQRAEAQRGARANLLQRQNSLVFSYYKQFARYRDA